MAKRKKIPTKKEIREAARKWRNYVASHTWIKGQMGAPSIGFCLMGSWMRLKKGAVGTGFPDGPLASLVAASFSRYLKKHARKYLLGYEGVDGSLIHFNDGCRSKKEVLRVMDAWIKGIR